VSKISIIRKVTPSNYLLEKQKFFADTQYIPNFTYDNTFTNAELHKYGYPKEEIADQARFVLEKTFSQYSENDIQLSQGPELVKDAVIKEVYKYLSSYSIQDRYKILTSDSLSARTMMTKESIILREPVVYREKSLKGMLHHEIGTHALRGINYEKQKWHKKSEEYGFQDYLRTEEGLATLHALQSHTLKSTYIAASRYLAAYYAQSHSFGEVWELMKPFFATKESLWTTVFRQKRGLTDTSQPGGFTKDIVYFEGAISVYNWVQKNNFDCTLLYYGKLALEDIAKAQSLNPNFSPLLPRFFTDNRDAYAENLQKIGAWNEF
jgi:hypothetical protein